MNNFNPYGVLGLESDADETAIKRAFRRRARKTHPDYGGDQEEFEQVKMAYEILKNPERRAQYDEDGTIGERRVDNNYGDAMQRIAGYLLRTIEQAAQWNQDLNNYDFVAGGTAFFKQENEKLQGFITNGERLLHYYEKVMKRLKTKRKDDLIKTMLKHHTGRMKEGIAGNQRDIHVNKMAMDILKDYEFVQDETEVKSKLILPNTGFWRNT